VLVKVHRNVTVVEVDEPILLTELKAATSLQGAVIRQVSETVVVVDETRLEALLDELVGRGYAPRVNEP
jgi:hypothetical protein